MTMTCPLCDIVAKATRGEHPGLIVEFAHGVVLLGDNQGCEGWCVLMLKAHVEHLDELSESVQREIFGEVSRVARAIRRVFPSSGVGGGPVRINYECLGNVVPHAHWHVIPRHAGDPTPRQTVWGWSDAALRGSATDAQRAGLVRRLRDAVERGS
jgi:diadenosine tetraphosphate (Ap4A) HIT family hydrolase